MITRDDIKSTWKTGYKITEADYTNLADSVSFRSDPVSGDYIDVNTAASAAPPQQDGRIFWDQESFSLSYYTNGATLQIGQEEFVRVYNKSGSTILNGTPVSIVSANGNRPNIEKTDASNFSSARCFLGLTTEEILNNSLGFVTTSGIIHDTDTSSFPESSRLWVSSSTPGVITSVEPSAGYKVRIGLVLVSHSNLGQIFVKPFVIPATLDLSRPWRFGDISNYSEFESDGTLKAVGNATVWNDINFSASNLRVGNSPPSWTNIVGGLYGYTFSASILEELHGCEELLHNYKEGSDISAHIHWSPMTTGLGNVVWGLEYSWVNKDDISSSTSTIYTTVSTSGTTGQHLVSAFPNIIGTGKKIGSYFCCRIFRDATNGSDTYAGSVFLPQFGIHYEIDTLGSRQIITK